MIVELDEDHLEHYGIRGMKWGVRRKNKTPLKPSSDFKSTANLRNRKPAELTNRQLKAANERLNLEVNYRRLNPSSVERGRAKATTILATVGIGVSAYNLIKSPAGQALIKNGRALIGQK